MPPPNSAASGRRGPPFVWSASDAEVLSAHGFTPHLTDPAWGSVAELINDPNLDPIGPDPPENARDIRLHAQAIADSFQDSNRPPSPMPSLSDINPASATGDADKAAALDMSGTRVCKAPGPRSTLQGCATLAARSAAC